MLIATAQLAHFSVCKSCTLFLDFRPSCQFFANPEVCLCTQYKTGLKWITFAKSGAVNGAGLNAMSQLCFLYSR